MTENRSFLSQKVYFRCGKVHRDGCRISKKIGLFLKFTLLLNFLEFSSPLPPSKKGWDLEGVENYVYSSKNLYNNIWLFLCVFVGAFWLFKMFLLLSAIFDMFFSQKPRTSIFMTKWNKIQAISSILPSSDNNKPIRKLFEPNKLKGQLSFLEIKILVWFTIIGYTLQNTLLDHTQHRN